MLNTIKKAALTIAALAAIGLGAAALSGAADKQNNSSSGSSSAGTVANGRLDPRGHDEREQLSAADAAKVKAAALKKVPGATVNETEAGGPYGSAYHAHITTPGGEEKVVLVDENFSATAVQDAPDRGGFPGGPHGGPGGPGGMETPLTGDKKQQVEDAVLAKYPGAEIERTETNAQGDAPYESHITTTAGKELEVLVSKDFKVGDAREHPAHP